MSVIAISRGSFLGGKRLAERLAQDLGFRCVDREVIIDKVAAAGVSHDDLREALTRPPSLFDRWITHRKHVYLALLQAALAEEVKDGNVVYHGYAGHLLLEGAGPVFRVRVIASTEFRLNIAQRELEMNRDRALAYLHEVDRDRARWTHALYGVNWDDPCHYDMVLNLGHLFDIEEASKVLANAVRENKCLEFTPARKAAMHDFALASRVNAALVSNRPTDVLHLKVKSLNGVISIEGTLDDDEQIKEVERVARSVPGIKDVLLRY
jgi:osmotically-inducible protein OsmY